MAALRGGALAVLFAAGVLIVILRRRAAWPLPVVVLLVMAVHILYFSSHRFAVPVFAQIALVAAMPLAAVLRSLMRWPRPSAAVAITMAVWTVSAQFIRSPGRYQLEAEDVEGISAHNVADEAASNGVARFAERAAGARPVAFLTGEAIPRGALGVRVIARPSECVDPAAEALTLVVQDAVKNTKLRQTYAVRDLCSRPGAYARVGAVTVLRQDEVLQVTVETTGRVDLYLDRLDLLTGYPELRQVRAALLTD